MKLSTIEIAKAYAEANGISAIVAHADIVSICKSKRVKPFTPRTEAQWLSIIL